MKRIGRITRPVKMTLDEMRNEFCVLSEESQREFMGGCLDCARNLPSGTVVYTESAWIDMMDAGTWTGGWVCGRGYVAAEAVYVGREGAYCGIHWDIFVRRNETCGYCAINDLFGYGYGYEEYYNNYGHYIGGIGGGSVGGGGSGGGFHGGSGSGSSSEVSYTFDDIMKSEYFLGHKDYYNCWDACAKMLKKFNITNPGSPNEVYQLLWEQNKNLIHYEDVLGGVAANYSRTLACIDRHLTSGRPIMIGVNHTLSQTINEGATDHFMLITGKGYDEERQQYYYTYTDPGRSDVVNGCNMENNKLYYNQDTNEFFDPEAGWENKRFDVTQVRPNDGLNLEETIAQPKRI